MVENNRQSGILLHISSLPGEDGIGGLGQEARKWIDFLSESGSAYWQILPINPTGFGNSPYQGLSAFAGNPLFIDLDQLVDDGLLERRELLARPKFPKNHVDYLKVSAWKSEMLHRAFFHFQANPVRELITEMDSFFTENRSWLQDYALFMAIREAFQGESWKQWPQPLRRRENHPLDDFQAANNENIQFHIFLQFLFAKQISAIKEIAREKDVRIIGDIPIFMGFDCADVWAHPHLFDLDQDLLPNAVAGVPPDFFSDSGQLWGNPLYDWNAHRQESYSWWSQRIASVLRFADVIRLDHFRGFAGYFRIPADSETAKSGIWMDGPGADFFDAVSHNIGTLPFIAEDLGVITPDVLALRDQYGFPGMRLLQFAFSKGADNEYLPHNYPVNCVAYTGTHDNDTAHGWYRNLPAPEKEFIDHYVGPAKESVPLAMIRTVWRSNAALAIAPMQDFLNLGTSARMNQPAVPEGNWQWRMHPGCLSPQLMDWIRTLNSTFGRENSK